MSLGSSIAKNDREKADSKNNFKLCMNHIEISFYSKGEKFHLTKP